MLIANWIARTLQWLCEVPTFWLFLLVLFSLVSLPVAVVETTEDAFRYAGLLLQMVGLGVVGYTLRDRGKAFKNKSVLKFAADWFSRFPSLHARERAAEISVVASSSTSMTGNVTVWRAQRLDQPIEAQIKDLYENLVRLRDEMGNISARTFQQMSELQNAIELERVERADQIQQTKRTLRKVAAESLYLEVAGFWWLVTGIILATIPRELVAGMRLLSP